MSELLVTGARIWDGRSLIDAEAVLIERGLVSALGDAAELAVRVPGARRIEARGATVTPGLCDAHVHLAPWARSLSQLDLHGIGSLDEALERVREAASRGEGVLVGRGWDESRWGSPPDRWKLDAAARGRPVLLHRHDFHALWVDSVALDRAGITRATPDPDGGCFERDAAGDPTGIVRENAVRAFLALEAAAGPPLDAALAATAASALHQRGITWVHDYQRSAEELQWSQALARTGQLRVMQNVGEAQLEGLLAAGVTSGTGDDRFRVGALKLFADGTLGSRTAAMIEPYDDHGATGLSMYSPQDLARLVQRAILGGISVTIHAIGDRAVRDALDAFASVPAEARQRLAIAPRIEHVQLAQRADLDRFSELGIVASMQPQHCVTDWEVATRAWGSRVEGSYPWRSLLDRGVLLVFGSDAPVEPPDPWLGLHASMTRRRPDGSPAGGFIPSQCLTLDEALRAYTSAAASVAGCTGRLGAIAPGAEGDVVIWDRDLHAADPDDLLTARPRCTVMAGRIVYESVSAARTPGPSAPSGKTP